MPPITVIGAAISSVHVICTSICTCCTSLVMRVISDGAPKTATSRAEKLGDLVEQIVADVATEAHRHLRADVDRGDRERDLHQRDQQHERRRCRQM